MSSESDGVESIGQISKVGFMCQEELACTVACTDSTLRRVSKRVLSRAVTRTSARHSFFDMI